MIKKLFVGIALLTALSSAAYTPQQPNLFEYEMQQRRKLARINEVANNTYKGLNVAIGERGNVPYAGVAGGSLYNFVDKDGRSYYITAKHIVKPTVPLDRASTSLRVFDIYDKDLEAKIEEIIPFYDAAIVSTKSDEYKSSAKTINLKDLVIGETAYVVGYPGADFRTLKKTNISSIVQTGTTKYLVLDEKASKGMSGGPVFVIRNGSPRLAGIIVMCDKEKDVQFALPSIYFENVMNKYAKK